MEVLRHLRVLIERNVRDTKEGVEVDRRERDDRRVFKLSFIISATLLAMVLLGLTIRSTGFRKLSSELLAIVSLMLVLLNLTK